MRIVLGCGCFGMVGFGLGSCSVVLTKGKE